MQAIILLLDDGRLTDGQGRTVDFKNTVIIMTSNIGDRWLHEYEGMNEDEIDARDGKLVLTPVRQEVAANQVE